MDPTAESRIAEPSPYTHDVFVSYSHEDTEWVRGELVPFLEGERLKVYIDYREFLGGEILRTCIERAVGSSRHVVVVLTPDWLKSDWARYEEMLASAEDPLRRKRTVVPLLLKPCTPDGWLKLLVYVDFTDPPRHLEQMKVLLRSLSEAPSAHPPQAAQSHRRPSRASLCGAASWLSASSYRGRRSSRR